jgi:hypothetical protein
MNSHMLTCGIYNRWMATATAAQIAFVDEVFALCERNYECGGDVVVECHGPEDVLAQFETLDAVREYVGLHNEQAANARWGEDTDPEVNLPAWQG